MSRKIAIDIGTNSIKVFVLEKGVCLSQFCAVAYDTQTDEIIAFGDNAGEMLEKTPSTIRVSTPIKSGIIYDFSSMKILLSRIIDKFSKGAFFKPDIIVSVPSSCTELQKKTIINLACTSGAGKVAVVDGPVASAYGCALSINEPYGTLVIDIGAGTTDIAVITMEQIAYSSTLPIGGNDIDDAIASWIRREKGIIIGQKTAEMLKNKIGSAKVVGEEIEIAVSGKHAVTSQPVTFYITNSEMHEAMLPVLKVIIEEIRKLLEKVPPEMFSDIAYSGMILTGGVSALRNIKQLFEEYLKIPTRPWPDGINSAVKGAGYMLKNIEKFEDDGLLFKLKHSVYTDDFSMSEQQITPKQ